MKNFLRYDSAATKKDIALDILQIVFPKGSYWYYPVCVAFVFGMFFTSTIVVLYLSMAFNGLEINTGTFVTQMPFWYTHFSDEAIARIGMLFNLFGCALLLFITFVGASFIADAIYGIIACYRWTMRKIRGERLW